MSDMSSKVTALPLAKAYDQYKRRELSWEDYFHNVFRLVAGHAHESDTFREANENNIWQEEYDDLRKADLLAYSIWHWHRSRLCIQGQ